MAQRPQQRGGNPYFVDQKKGEVNELRQLLRAEEAGAPAPAAAAC